MFNGKYLYHFSKISSLESIILNNTLRLSKLSKMNDPKEFNGWPFKFYDNLEERSYEKISLNDFLYLDNQIKNNWYISCFKFEENNDEINDIYNQNTAYYDLKMWDHYGDRHSGCCLVINYEKLNIILNKKRDAILYHGMVKYSLENESFRDPFEVNYSEYSQGDTNLYLEELCSKNYLTYFFTKQPCWKDENEYRIVCYSKDDIDYIDLDLNDAIEAIILGCKFNNYESSIFKLCSDKCIPIFNLVSNNWHNELVKNEAILDESISLNHLSFSTLTQTNYFVLKAQSSNGKTKLILVKNDGSVSVL